MTGMVGNKWSCSDFSAIHAIPAAVREIMGTDSLKAHITEKRTYIFQSILENKSVPLFRPLISMPALLCIGSMNGLGDMGLFAIIPNISTCLKVLMNIIPPVTSVTLLP